MNRLKGLGGENEATISAVYDQVDIWEIAMSRFEERSTGYSGR
jgi:hypothetical protein